jgi:hypothetical protein
MNWHQRGITGPVAIVAAVGIGSGVLGMANNNINLAQSGLTFIVMALVFALERRIEIKIHDLRSRLDELEAKRISDRARVT